MRFSPKRIKDLLQVSRKGIYNSIANDFISPMVSTYGYTQEKLAELQTLHVDVEALVRERENKQGMKVAVNIRLVKAIDKVYKRTALYVYYAKRDFKNARDLISEYKLNATRPKNPTEKLEYAKNFYQRCKDIEGLGTHMAQYSLTPEILDTLQADIVNIEKEDDFKTILKKDTETSTIARNKLAEQLYDNWLKYKATLILVLEDDPQQLEAFGIIAYSEGYKPKKKEDETGETDDDGETGDDNGDITDGNDDDGDTPDNTDDNTGDETGENIDDKTDDKADDKKVITAPTTKKKVKSP